jgi:hypothetical protein
VNTHVALHVVFRLKKIHDPFTGESFMPNLSFFRSTILRPLGFQLRLLDDGFQLQSGGHIAVTRRYPGLSAATDPAVASFLTAEARNWAQDFREHM